MIETTRLGKWLCVPSFHRWEAMGIRALLAIVTFRCLPLQPLAPHGGFLGWLFGPKGILAPDGRVTFESQPVPTGIAKWDWDLTWIAAPELQPWLWIICVASLGVYVFGRGLMLLPPLIILTAVMIVSRTLENSQGFMYHIYQVIGLVLLAQTIAGIVYAIIKLCGKAPKNRNINDYIIRYAQIAIVGAYMIAGFSKFIYSDGEWIKNSPYFGIDIIRTNKQNYYADLEGDRPYEIARSEAARLLENPTRARLMMGTGLLLELGAFIALFHRVLALFAGIAVMAFHILIADLMEPTIL
ncbi:MAG: hypothetical protein AAF585_29655, partial [Verrucomicrobiota bacterium]